MSGSPPQLVLPLEVEVTPAPGPRRARRKDIAEMRDHLDGWALHYSLYVRYERLVELLETGDNRRLIVVGGLRGFAARDRERANGHTGYRRAAAAWRRLGSPDVAARMDRFGDRCKEGAAWREHLVDEVEANGLPLSVATYTPRWLVDRTGGHLAAALGAFWA